MSNLSEKQILFRDYLLSRLGFIKDKFLESYKLHLESASLKFRFLGIKEKEVSPLTGENFPKNGNDYIKYVEYDDYFLPEKFSIIDYLNYEINLRRNTHFKFKPQKSNFIISASDIASYVYCPVGFSIIKSFELFKLESTTVGSDSHQKSLILNHLNQVVEDKFNDNEYFKIYHEYIDDSNMFFFEILENSELIYSGHSPNISNRYFKNLKGNFIGQPDFLLHNKSDDKYFVVEEKFQNDFNNKYLDYEDFDFYSENKNVFFYKNHESQVNAYLHGISEYDISYGFLVYWKYNIVNGMVEITRCSVKKIIKDDRGRVRYVDDFKNVSILMKQGKGIFNKENRNASKCANCVSNYYCGHKTGQFKEYTFPYSPQFLSLKFVEFPQELKKKNDE